MTQLGRSGIAIANYIYTYIYIYIYVCVCVVGHCYGQLPLVGEEVQAKAEKSMAPLRA